MFMLNNLVITQLFFLFLFIPANFLLHSNFILNLFDNFNSLKQQMAFKIPKENYANNTQTNTQKTHRTVSLCLLKIIVCSKLLSKGHIPV